MEGDVFLAKFSFWDIGANEVLRSVCMCVCTKHFLKLFAAKLARSLGESIDFGPGVYLPKKWIWCGGYFQRDLWRKAIRFIGRDGFALIVVWLLW